MLRVLPLGGALSSTQYLCPCTAVAQKLVLGLDSVSPSKEDGESLVHNVALFGSRVFSELIKLKYTRYGSRALVFL